jgi:2-hydroxychromene-2-carboxylate isomerase
MGLAGMLRDRIQRTLAPRTVVALSRLHLPRLRPRVELYFAYDDPYAALALPGLLGLTRARGLPLHLYPLLERGIAGDPAAQQRARYCLVDADRLLQRGNRRLARQQPLAAADCSFLAAWTQAAAGDAAVADFAAAAVELLWLHSDGPVELQPYARLHHDILGRQPAADSAQLDPELRRNTRRLHARGHWESPAARVNGEWFFAHERLAQIAERLPAP